MKGSVNFNNVNPYLSYIDNADVEGGTDLTPIIKAMTVGDQYEVYVGTSVDQSNKLGFEGTVINLGSYQNHTVKGILFKSVGLDTGSAFAVCCESDSNRRTKLCIPNCSTTGLDTDALANESVNSMADIKRVLGKFMASYQTKATRLYTTGMWYIDTAFFVNLAENVANDETSTWVNAGNIRMVYRTYNVGLRSIYISLRSFWNWYSMIVGEFRLPVQYLETQGGKRIYITLPVSGVDDDNLFYDSNDYSFFDNLNANGKPSVAWDYQSGTNLLSLVNSPGESIVLKNGSILSLERQYDNVNNRYYFKYKLINNVGDNDLDVIAAFNVDGIVGDMVGQGYHNSISDYLLDRDSDYDIGVDNPYFSSTRDAFLLRGVYFMSTPYEEAGLVRYADDNASQPASFFNQYPTTPLTIAGCYTGSYGCNYKDEGNWTYRAAAWGFDNVFADLMVSNIGGYTSTSSSAQGYLNIINMFTTCKPSNTISTFSIGGGDMKVNSAVGFKTLFGIISNIDPIDPDHGEGSIGGGGGGTQEGGNGSYDDTGDDVGFSTGVSFGASATITNWYLGALNSEGANTNLELIGNWLRTTLDPDAQQPWQGLGYKYSDKLANICSLKIIYSPDAPAISGPLIPHIHGQILHGSGDPNPIAYKVTNQYKQTAIRLNFNIAEYFGSFLDYAPYTRIQIYLPFAGVHELNPSDVVGKDLTLHCSVDWITGDIVYNIRVNTGTCNSIIYTFSGNSAVDLPLTATDYSGKVMSGIQTLLSTAGVVAGIAGAGATGGASLGVVAGALASAGANALSFMADQGVTHTKGSIGGVAGALSPMQCYLIVTRPKKVEAEAYGSINGYPCMKSYKIGDLEGFIQVHKCNWSIPGATEDELNEIESLMRDEGAII